MTDDPIDEALVRGFELERQKLEALASKLGFPPETSSGNPPTPPNPLDSEAAKDGALVVTDLLGVILRDIVFAERPRPPSPRPRLSRFFFRSPVVAPPAPPPVVAAATAPVPAPAPNVAPGKPAAPTEPSKTSGTPNTAMSFVGFRDDRPKARESTRFPTEPLSAHEQRLDLDHDEPPIRRALRGPVVGAADEDSTSAQNYPHSRI